MRVEMHDYLGHRKRPLASASRARFLRQHYITGSRVWPLEDLRLPTPRGAQLRRALLSSFYQSMLGIEAGALALVAAVMIGVQQLVAGTVSRHAAMLVIRGNLVVVGTSMLAATLLVTLFGAVLLSAPHDFVPGANLRVDHWLSMPGVGLGVGVGTTVGASLLVLAASRALRLLDPVVAARLLLRRFKASDWAAFGLSQLDEEVGAEDIQRAARGTGLDLVAASALSLKVLASDWTPHAGDPVTDFGVRLREVARDRREAVSRAKENLEAGRLHDPLASVVDVADRAIATGDRRAFLLICQAMLTRGLGSLEASANQAAFGADELERSLASELIGTKLGALVRRSVDHERLDFMPLISDALTESLGGVARPSMVAESTKLLTRMCRVALTARAGGVLSQLIDDVATHAVISLRFEKDDREACFDNACVVLGFPGGAAAGAIPRPRRPRGPVRH